MGLEIGMKKVDVLRLADKLSTIQKQKVYKFLENDRDGQISHENELAILNSFFDGTNKVKMPKNSVGANLDGHKVSSCSHKNQDGTTTWSLLYDDTNDGYADGHNIGEYTVKDRISTGWRGVDTNIDGIADKKGRFRTNLDDMFDPNNRIPGYEKLEQIKVIDITF